MSLSGNAVCQITLSWPTIRLRRNTLSPTFQKFETMSFFGTVFAPKLRQIRKYRLCINTHCFCSHSDSMA